MSDWRDLMQDRTYAFALAVVRLTRTFPLELVPRPVCWQLIKSTTSVASNHRAARRSRSDRELYAKLSIIDEEADESVFWLELAQDLLTPRVDKQLTTLLQESVEIRNIFAKARSTVRLRLNAVGDE